MPTFPHLLSLQQVFTPSPPSPHPVPGKSTFILKIPHLFPKAAELLERGLVQHPPHQKDSFLLLSCGTKSSVFSYKCFVSLQGALFCFQLLSSSQELFEFQAEARNGFERENSKCFVIVFFLFFTKRPLLLFYLPEETIP